MIQAAIDKMKDKIDDGLAAPDAGRFVRSDDQPFSGFISGTDIH
jgi:predicted transcriptional regulator